MTARLPDSPIAAKAEDQFGRARLAGSLAEVIDNAPHGSSMRIGIYGEWGEGKSSVLRLMEERLAEIGHVCVWVAPWLGKTTEEVWEQILTSIAEKLEVKTARLRVAAAAVQSVEAARSVAGEAHWGAKFIAGVVGEPLKQAMERLAAAQRENMKQSIDRRIAEKKIIVFVDDLDRTDHSIVPKLLMSLRELFDAPNFYFVLALSPKVVAAGLTHVGFGGEQPERFLEKIVELPVRLPPLDDRSIARYIGKGIDAIRDSVRVEELQGIVSFLPRNPRRIKLYLRFLASLSKELDRFRDDEISWRMLYLALMLRLEFPDEVRALAADDEAVADLHHGKIRVRSLSRAENSEAEQPLEAKYAPPERAGHERFLHLCQAMREIGGLSSSLSLADMLLLIERPPVFTLKELDLLFVDFNGAQSKESQRVVLEAFIGSDESGQLDLERAEQAFGASILIRDSQLDQAVNSESREQLAACAANALRATGLIRFQIEEMGCFKLGLLGARSWLSLYSHGLKWSRFHRQKEYAALRKEEEQLLLLSSGALPTEAILQVLEKRPFEEHHRVGGEAATFLALGERIRSELSAKAVSHILTLFEVDSGLQRYWAIEWGSMGKWLLFERGSPFHTKRNRKRLIALLRKSSRQRVIHENALTYFRMLCYGAFEGGSFVVRECRELLQDTELVSLLWKAAVARPLNPRVAGTFRGYRDLLVKGGLDEASVPRPGWWRQLEGSFFKPLDQN